MHLMNDGVLLEEIAQEGGRRIASDLVHLTVLQTIRARVVETGPGTRRHHDAYRNPMSVSPGDEVIVPTRRGTPVFIDGKHYIVLKEDDILVYFKPVKRQDEGEEE